VEVGGSRGLDLKDCLRGKPLFFEFLDKGLEACLCGFLAILLKASDDQEFFGRSEFLGLLGEERCEGQDAQGEREREPS
jgi:hypothetical protein